ncbi:MAG TPA: SLC13 family permease, partial [Mycobacterium sp.]|nr:SLC13 family permease [Mycobacterium sp.]
MMYYAIAVFVIAYALIISERFNKTTVALVGAGFMVCLPVIDSPDVFYSQNSGIDWDVIFLMLGMMVIVSILRQTGAFEYAAIWAVKRANGSPLRIMILLMLVMALASAILPNVVSVLLIAPVTLLLCERLEINPVPFLIAEVFASNVGGAATLVGDPPNIIIGARKGLSFNAFFVNMAPAVVLVMLVLIVASPLLFRGLSTVNPERVAEVIATDDNDLLQDRGLLIKCGIVVLAVLAGFIVSPTIHMAPSLVAMLGAGVLILWSRLDQSDYTANVEWDTLLFIVGLFIMVGALLKTGVIGVLGRWAAGATGGNMLLATMMILIVSTVASG